MKKCLILLALIVSAGMAFSQKRIAPPVKSPEEILNETYCGPLFSSANGQYFDMLDDRNRMSALAYLNVLEWLNGRVAGLQVFTTRDRLQIPLIRNQRATVFVNEMRVDYSYLTMLPVSDIAMIKIIKEPFLGGWGGGGGVIAIYLQTGEDDMEEEG